MTVADTQHGKSRTPRGRLAAAGSSVALLASLLAVGSAGAREPAEVDATLDCEGVITVTATAHAISNIVVRTSDGDTKIEEPFEGEGDEPDPELFEYTLAEADYGDVTSVFVKAGNNRSGAGPGYGEEVTIDEPDDCGPVLGTGDVQVTLAFASEPPESVDMDLYVIDPLGERIAYYNTTSASGGELDRDDDVCGTADDGFSIENVFWAEESAPPGTYTVGVDEYAICADNTGGPAEWTLTVEVDGVEVLTATGVGDDDPAIGEAGPSNTFSFDYPTP